MLNTNTNSGLNQMKLLAKIELPNLAEWYSTHNFWVDTNPASLAQNSISWVRKLQMGWVKKWNVTRHNKEQLWWGIFGQILIVE